MRNLRFNHTCEHRFVFAEGEEPQASDQNLAFPVTDPVDIPDTDLKAQVWRIQRGAEISIHEREADKLSKLQDADGIAYATEGELAELPVLVAPDPTDPQDRTPREEVERLAADAGHTPEGELIDHDKHREYARRSGFEAGGPAAPAMTPTAGRVAPPPRPAAAGVGPRAEAAGRPAAPSPGSAGAPQTTQPPASAAGASAQPLPPGVAAPQAVGGPPSGNTGVAGPLQGGQAPNTPPPPGVGPGAPAPVPGQRQNVNIQGSMAVQPGQPGQPGQAPGVAPTGAPASAAPSAPQSQPR